MPSTRISQNTQVGSDRAKKGEITLSDICLLLVIGQNITLCARIQASNPGTLTTLLFSHVRTCHLSFLVEPVLLAFDNYCHFRIQSLSSFLDPYMPHIMPTSTLESSNLEVLMDIS